MPGSKEAFTNSPEQQERVHDTIKKFQMQLENLQNNDAHTIGSAVILYLLFNHFFLRMVPGLWFLWSYGESYKGTAPHQDNLKELIEYYIEIEKSGLNKQLCLKIKDVIGPCLPDGKAIGQGENEQGEKANQQQSWFSWGKERIGNFFSSTPPVQTQKIMPMHERSIQQQLVCLRYGPKKETKELIEKKAKELTAAAANTIQKAMGPT